LFLDRCITLICILLTLPRFEWQEWANKTVQMLAVAFVNRIGVPSDTFSTKVFDSPSPIYSYNFETVSIPNDSFITLNAAF
jgi:hypothetical protein